MTICSLPLSYCTNVHPGRTLEEVIDGLSEHAAEARRQLDVPMAAGLWLPATVVAQIADQPESLERLAQVLWQNDLCCYTLNTFPYGDFHSDRVKEQVYLPDWSCRSRIEYTEQSATLLAQLLPEHGEGSLSTVPLGGRMNPTGPEFIAVCMSHLIQYAGFLRQLFETTGRKIRLAVEPEPMCHLDTTADHTVPIFRRLFEMAEAKGCEEVVREYIGLCFDVCHQAVVFEDVTHSLDLIERDGIRINKVHITNAVELPDPSHNPEGRAALCEFAEPRYLHQTYAKLRDGQIGFRKDLLTEDILRDPPDEFLKAEAWRVHFHVPVYAETLGPLRTTRPELIAALRRVAALSYAPQLEVETYTWPVMPDASSHPGNAPASLAERIARELRSTYELLNDT